MRIPTVLRRPTTAALDRDGTREVLMFAARLRDCTVLRSRAEIAAASHLVQQLGLPSHHDPQKNWDTLKALYYLVAGADPTSRILDAGAGSGSVILRWLHQLGYRNLHACDVVRAGEQYYRALGIDFTVQDLASTNFGSDSFDGVACISVIEHGIALDAFVSEMARILRRGGILTVSTDFWSEPIDCTGIFPYGENLGEMKILGPRDIAALCASAERAGFSLATELDLRTGERAVRWDRVAREYTFAFLAFQKVV